MASQDQNTFARSVKRASETSGATESLVLPPPKKIFRDAAALGRV